MGVRYLSEGNYEEAIIAFTAAIEIDPKRPEGYSGLANTYIAMGDYDSAAGVWESISTETVGEDAAFFSMWQQKSEDIRTALENGESGVWIISCSFDKECFTAGEETEFQVVTFYNAVSDVEYSLYLSANTEEAYGYRSITDTDLFSISGGKGVCTLTGAAIPVQWGSHFCLSVYMCGDGDDGYFDRIYLTPEGGLSESYAPLNAYGSAEFTCRKEYLNFSALDGSAQSRVAEIAQAVIAGEQEMLLSLVSAEDGIDDSFYTIWNGYKIQIWDETEWRYNEESYEDDGIDRSKSFYIQMRSENGIGYYCSVHRSQIIDTPTDGAWMDYYDSVNLITCPCVDWQWNGAVIGLTYNNYLWRDSTGTTCHTIETSTIDGNMTDGLWEGVATQNIHEICDWNKWDDTDETYVITRTFQNGIQTEQNGEPWMYGKGYHFISDYDGGGRGYSERQWQDFLDECYW